MLLYIFSELFYYPLLFSLIGIFIWIVFLYFIPDYLDKLKRNNSKSEIEIINTFIKNRKYERMISSLFVFLLLIFMFLFVDLIKNNNNTNIKYKEYNTTAEISNDKKIIVFKFTPVEKSLNEDDNNSSKYTLFLNNSLLISKENASDVSNIINK